MKWRSSLVISLALACASLAAPDSGGEVAGHVIDGLTGKGVARARVVVVVSATDRMVLLTDDEGAFRVSNLPAGSVSVWAQRNGYLGDPFESPTPASRAQVLISGSAEKSAPLTLTLTPQAVIEGRAVDAKGGGVALVRLWEQGSTGKVVVRSEKRVDRTGEFRFPALAAGRYYLEVSSLPASSSPERNPVYSHRFYKEGTALESATPVDVEAGQTENIPILLESAQGRQVRGRTASVLADTFVYLHLSPNDAPFAVASVDKQTRTFTFPDVPPGTYLIEADWNADGKAVHAYLPIIVADGDLNDIVLSPSAP